MQRAGARPRKNINRCLRVRAAAGVHRLRELAVEIPAVGGVDLILELSHLLHEGVEIGIRVGHPRRPG